MPSNFSYILPGKLAGCAEPGRMSDFRRDLSDLSVKGIGAIVSLTEKGLDRTDLREFDFRYLHLPIPDFTPPTPAQIGEFIHFVDACIADGLAVVTHCAAGMGRTGTMLACYLVHLGWKPAEAIRKIRRERPGSVETVEQEWSVAGFYNQVSGRHKKPR